MLSRLGKRREEASRFRVSRRGEGEEVKLKRNEQTHEKNRTLFPVPGA